jgi:formylmethanofuran--tetrahydromethanopterin N-formyltransferase
MTGFATSVIGCKVEAGIEAELDAGSTPDGRPGASVLLFAFDREGLGKRLVERVGQTVLTCPTTACFDGLPDAPERVPVGGQLRYFGDGFQASKLLGGRRYWRIPVMEGEFLVEESFGARPAVGGGNLLILARDADAALEAAEAAVAAMRRVRGVVLPFPGGIVRSGSKVGSRRYKGLMASTNDAYCPTLRGRIGVRTELPPEANAVLEIVVNGVDAAAVAAAMRAGIPAACRPGVVELSAGNYGGKLGRHHLRRDARRHGGRQVSAVVLTPRAPPAVPLEAPCIRPEAFAALAEGEIAALPVWHGNEAARLGDFFDVRGGRSEEVRVAGDASRVKQIGAGMSAGRLHVEGGVGMHAGAGMTGGWLRVEGDAGDWAGAEMRGGVLEVAGSAAAHLGGAYPGSVLGMRGGTVLARGRAGELAGARMRRGTLVVGEDAGEYAGAGMIAGTILVFGALGRRAGMGLKRGSIVAFGPAQPLPTFRYACRYAPPFLPLYLRELRARFGVVEERFFTGAYHRYNGDFADLGKGEMLVWGGA